jgi:hypothetical protein
MGCTYTVSELDNTIDHPVVLLRDATPEPRVLCYLIQVAVGEVDWVEVVVDWVVGEVDWAVEAVDRVEAVVDEVDWVEVEAVDWAVVVGMQRKEMRHPKIAN